MTHCDAPIFNLGGILLAIEDDEIATGGKGRVTADLFILARAGYC